MFTFIVEFVSVTLAAGCIWHAARFESRAFVEQWFGAGYLTALIVVTLDQAILQTHIYSPTILRIGIAPALVTLLTPVLLYLGYHFARRIGGGNLVLVSGLLFFITASLALPLEATATQMRWWLYPDAGRVVFASVPLSAPVIWGGAALVFYAVFRRIGSSRLPDRGRLYALITLAPVIAVVDLAWALLMRGLFG